MQMYKEVVEEYEYSYSNNGSDMHMMKPAAAQHSYNQSHGHAPETRYEDGWGGAKNNDHYALGGKVHHGGNEGMKHGGYGADQGHFGHYKEGMGMKHGGYGGDQGHFGHHKEGMGMKHGGYGGDQGHFGHYKEVMGMKNGGYGADHGHMGYSKEGMKHGGYGAHQGHYGPPHQKVSVWELKSIVD